MAYLGKTPSQAVRSRYYYTATGGETSLSGADDNSNVLTFADGNYVDVALNGVTLVAGTDYNTTTANTIAGLTALVASDVVEVIVYDTFSVFGGNMAANLNFKDNVKANFGTGNDLQIYHDGSNSIIAEASIGSLKIQGSDLYLTDDNGTNMLYAANNGGVTLYNGGAAKLATTATGVDVTGTVTADYLNITAADNAITSKIANTTGANYLQITNGTANGYFGTTGANTVSMLSIGTHPLTFGVDGGTERMRIDSDGNVGIGTSSPTTGKLVINSTQTGTEKQLVLRDSTNGWTRKIGVDTSNNLGFFDGDTERLRIDSSGNLLVGTTDTVPSNNGAGGDAGLAFTPDGAIRAARSGNNPLDINRMDSDGDIAAFRKDGITVGSIGYFNSPEFIIGRGSNGIGFSSTVNALYPTNPASGAIRDNAMDLGYPSIRWKDIYLSGGVYLGGTGSANRLNDYEEGTHTFGEIHGQASITTNRGLYIKVGSKVMVSASVEVGANSNPNTLNLSLPFTSNIGGYYAGGGFVTYTNLSTSTYSELRATVENSASNVFFITAMAHI